MTLLFHRLSDKLHLLPHRFYRSRVNREHNFRNSRGTMDLCYPQDIVNGAASCISPANAVRVNVDALHLSLPALFFLITTPRMQQNSPALPYPAPPHAILWVTREGYNYAIAQRE